MSILHLITRLAGYWALVSALLLGIAEPGSAQTRFGQWDKLPFPWVMSVFPRADLGDMDGDGDLDLVAARDFRDQPSVYRNDGRGFFFSKRLVAKAIPAGWSWEARFADVDGDGDLDILSVQYCPFGAKNRLYVNDGKGTFKDVTDAQMPSTTSKTGWSLAIGDLDRDGDVDVVFGGNGGQNLLYLNDGKGRFKDVTKTWMPMDTKNTLSVALADVNGDGWLDILAGNNGPTQTNDIYLNTTRGGFRLMALSSRTNTTLLVLPGDVDGDGDVDVVVLNWGFSNTHELHLNDGKGRFTDRSDLLPRPDRNFSLQTGSLADFDGDGDLDLCVGGQSRPTPPLRYYANDGKGGFVDRTSQALPGGLKLTIVHALPAGDLDGDGDVDLLVLQAGFFSLPSLVLFNLTRHVFAPKDAVLGQPYPLDLFGKPGHVLFPALATARRATRLGGLGTLWLDPNAAILLPGVSIGASGRARVVVPVPTDPFLRGKTFFFQALDFVKTKPGASHLTNYGKEMIK